MKDLIELGFLMVYFFMFIILMISFILVMPLLVIFVILISIPGLIVIGIYYLYMKISGKTIK